MRIAALQMVSTPEIDRNLEIADRLIRSAAEDGAQLVLLPEVFATLEGLSPLSLVAERDASTSVGAVTPLQDFLSERAAAHAMTVIGGTLPLMSRPDGSLIDDGRVRASSLVYGADGERRGRYDKIHLFDVTVDDAQSDYSESRSYEAGTDVSCVQAGELAIGLSVCYDLRFAELYAALGRQGAQLLTVPAAFTAVTGAAHWEPLLRARAIENQCFVIAAAQGGRHSPSRVTWGHSMIVSPWGEVLDCCETGEGVAIADIDLGTLDELRARMPIAAHRRL